MAPLGPILGTLANVAAIGGTILSVTGAIQEGKEQKARFEYDQKVASQQADEATAASQRDANARAREGRMILSQQQAAIAGSGGNINDPSVIKLMDDTKDQVNLAVQTDIYKGDQQARGYNDAAKVAGYNANSAMRAARLKALGNLFEGVSSMYSRFGQPAQKPGASSSAMLPYG